MSAFDEMSREDLRKALEMFAKNWLAHDGCWFLAAEEQLGMAAAIELDAASWARFAAVEANRILTTFNIEEGGGLAALDKALGLRMYSLINAQRTEWSEDRRTFTSDCGYLSRTRGSPPQRTSGFSLQERWEDRIRYLCAHG